MNRDQIAEVIAQKVLGLSLASLSSVNPTVYAAVLAAADAIMALDGWQTTHEWAVKVEGEWVAGGDCPDAASAWREGAHYAMQYASEGISTAEVFEVARRAAPLPQPPGDAG